MKNGIMAKKTGTKVWGIGALSDETGVNIETIRYYEKIGLLPPPPRTAGGNRQYDETALRRLFFVRRCRELGFSIAEIRALLKMVDQKGVSCSEVHAVTMEHLETVREKIAALKKMEETLDAMALTCGRGDVPECPIIDTLFDVDTAGTEL